MDKIVILNLRNLKDDLTDNQIADSIRGLLNPRLLVDIRVVDESSVADKMTTARQAAAQDAYERAGKLIDLCAAQYPADIWPDDSTHPDAIAAKTMRVMLPKIADRFRALAAAVAEGKE